MKRRRELRSYGTLPPWAKVVDCAMCGRVLLSKSNDVKYIKSVMKHHAAPPVVFGEVHGRPYCYDCVQEQVKREGVF